MAARQHKKEDDAAFNKARKGGRPSLLTPDLIKAIAQHIEAGLYVETACAVNDISRETYYAWLREGAHAKSGLKKEFSDMVKRSVAKSEARDVLAITKAVQNGNPKWAAWRLERKHPSRWGRRDTVNVEHGGEIAVRVQQRREALLNVARDPQMREALIRMSHALRPARVGAEVIDGQVIETEGGGEHEPGDQ